MFIIAAKVFEEFSGLSVGKYCGEMKMFDWTTEIATHKVLVFTAGLLETLLKPGTGG